MKVFVLFLFYVIEKSVYANDIHAFFTILVF